MATPEEYDRSGPESDLATSLSERLAEVRASLERGEPVDWARFESEIRQDLEDELALVFVAIYLLMRDDASRARQRASSYSRQRAEILTSRLRRNIRSELSVGQVPARVLNTGRASAIAVTEVTGAISNAETAARQDRAQEDPSKRASDKGTAAPGNAGQAPVIVDDGVIATWQTAEDERVCPICGPLNDKPPVIWSRDFPNGPPAHVNCRCWLVYRPAN